MIKVGQFRIAKSNFSPLLSTPAFPDTSENIFEGDLLCRSVRAHSGSARQGTRPACCSPQPVGSCLRDAQTQGTLPGVRLLRRPQQGSSETPLGAATGQTRLSGYSDPNPDRRVGQRTSYKSSAGFAP